MSIKDERGTIMIESTFCLIATIIVLIGILGFGFIMYQRAMFSIVCNQIAEEVIHTYKLEDVQTADNVSKEDVIGVPRYRYLFAFFNNLEENTLENCKVLTEERLEATSFAIDDGDMTVEITPSTDDIGRYHYKIVISKPYKFLFNQMFDGSMFESLNINNTMQSTVYVQGVDVLAYFNTVGTTQYALRKVESEMKILQSISSLLELVNNIIGFDYGAFT